MSGWLHVERVSAPLDSSLNGFCLDTRMWLSCLWICSTAISYWLEIAVAILKQSGCSLLDLHDIILILHHGESFEVQETVLETP